MTNYFIGEDSFRIFLPQVAFAKSSSGDEEAYNSRKLAGIMSTQRKDRQDEAVIAKGLEFDEFLHNGHFNDNHSQETSAIVGYPEKVQYHSSLEKYGIKAPGWTCEGFVLKGTKRADGIWELAQSLANVPTRKLGFSIEGKVLRRSDKTIECAKIRNVAITNCFPGDTSVEGAADKITRRWYSGEMIEIHLASGEKLTGTPNHPIFTQRGWIGLGDLDEVNDRVGRFDADLAKATSLSKISHNVNHMPATIEQIFNASLVSGNPLWINEAREGNFHGDGAGSDVDVVLAKGFLRDNLQAAFLQKFGKHALTASDKQLPRLFGLGFFSKLLSASLATSASYIRSLGISNPFASAAFRIFQPVFFLNSTSDAVPFGNLVDTHTTDVVTGGDKGRTLSPAISFNNISLKRRFDFNGHVFNLDTKHGWYHANGVVVHNCPVNTDCTWDVLSKSMTEPEMAIKSMMAGAGTSPATQSGGGALRGESLDKDPKDTNDSKKKKRQEALFRALHLDDMSKAMDIVMEQRPDFDEEAAAFFVNHLFRNGGKL